MKLSKIIIFVFCFMCLTELCSALDNGYEMGTEFHVNTYTTSRQGKPTASSNGTNFFTAWESDGQDGHFLGTFGQMLDNDGTKIGTEFQINTYTLLWQGDPAISSDGTDFIATWFDNIQDGDGPAVFGQVFSGNGTMIGSEFQISTYTTSSQFRQSIASDGTRYFTVWQSDGQDGSGEGIYGQILDNDGTDIGSEFRINKYTANDQSHPSVSSTGTTYLVAWESREQDGDKEGIYGRIYDINNLTSSDEFQISTYTTNAQFETSTASDGTNYLAVWTSDGQDGNGFGVYGQLLNQDATKNGTEFQISTYTTNDQRKPVIASNGTSYLVVWQSDGQDGDNDGVYAQLLDHRRNKIGSEFQVNSYTLLDQWEPSVTSLGGDYLIIWRSEGQNGDQGEIFAKKLTYSDPVITAHPLSKTAYEGSDAVFSITASTHNGSIHYQWYKNTIPIGTDSNTLELTNISSLDNDTDIYCVVSDPIASRTSQTTKLIVLPSYSTGQEMLVNTYTALTQAYPATSSNGTDFIITWQSEGQDNDGYGIYAQIVDSNGSKTGTEFQLNSYTTNHQKYPFVTSKLTNYLVVWQSFGQDGDQYGIFGQLVDNDGSTIGTEFQINSYTPLRQQYPCVTSGDNNYLVVWESKDQDGDGYGIFAQIIDNDGTKIGAEFQINSYTNSDQGRPVVSYSNNTYFVVWQSSGQDGSYSGVFGQIIDNDGTKIGAEFQINTYTSSFQINPSLSSNGTNYMVVWESLTQDIGSAGIFAQLIDNEGAKIGAEFQINSYTTHTQTGPSVTSNGNDYLVVWHSYEQNGEHYEIYGRLFNDTGNPITEEIHINTITDNEQSTPSVTSNGTDFLVAWNSNADGQYDIYSTLINYISLTITQHPIDQTVDVGESAQFGVTAYAQSTTLHYAWYVNNILTGTDSDTLILTDVQLSDNDSAIYCVVSDDNGSLTSEVATLTVLPPITITQQPQPQTTYINEPVEFTVLATSEVTLHYQWYHKKTSVTIPIGTDSNVVTVTDPQLDDNNTAIYCEVSNYAYKKLSNKAMLTVLEPSFTISIKGDGAITENRTAQYTAFAIYGGGSIYEITDSAIWSVEPSEFADITSTGLLNAHNVDQDQRIILCAEYDDGSETHWGYFTVMIDNLFQVTDMNPYPDSKITTSPETIVISCNEHIDPASISMASCRLLEPGDDDLFGTGDDIPILIIPTLEDPYTIHLNLGNLLLHNSIYQVKLSGIKNVTSKALDGEYYGLFPSGNGFHGGDFTATFSVSREFISITYNDNDDTVSLRWKPFREGVSYRIDSTNSINPPHWVPVEPESQWPTKFTNLTDNTLHGETQRFYRAVGAFSFITSVTPAEGAQGDSLIVELVGRETQWSQSQSDVSFGEGITIDSINVDHSEHISLKITIDSLADLGLRDVAVMTGLNIDIKENSFEVIEP